jgi:hypothetical protein
MQTPQFLLDLLQLLLDLAAPAAFCTLAAAGMSLRHEGGINFHVNGRTGKWILWTVVLLTLPELLSWIAATFRRRCVADWWRSYAQRNDDSHGAGIGFHSRRKGCLLRKLRDRFHIGPETVRTLRL